MSRLGRGGRLIVALYPRDWRRRYGEELEALLDDSNGGWSDVFDVIKGAIVMQMKSVRVPLVGAMLGAMAGAAIYLASPAAYASSAVVRVPGAPHPRLEAALASVLSDVESRAATHVVLEESSRDSSMIRITHFASDAAQAYRVAEALVAAASTPDTPDAVSGPGTAGTVIEAPRLPTVAERTGDPWSVAFGAVAGLFAGTAVLALRRTRARRSAN